MRGDEQLKPCPFCGEPAELCDFNDGRYMVQCQNPACGVLPYTSIHSDKFSAVIAWNGRPTSKTHAMVVSDESTDCATGHCECELCGKPIDPWDAYCRHCGAEVVEWYT